MQTSSFHLFFPYAISLICFSKLIEEIKVSPEGKKIRIFYMALQLNVKLSQIGCANQNSDIGSFLWGQTKKKKKRYDSEFDDDGDNMLPEITFSNQTHCAKRSLLTGRGGTQRVIADFSQLRSWKSLHSSYRPELKIINKCIIILFLNYRRVQRLKCPIFSSLVRKLCSNKLRRNLMNFKTWGDNCTHVCFV